MTDPGDQEPERVGSVHPTSAGLLVVLGCLGLVLGWATRQFALRAGFHEPSVGVATIGLIAFAAAALAWTAHSTRRARDLGVRLEPHRMVNRLVLAKTCAQVGAFFAGGYAGYAVSQIGGASELAGERFWSSLAAAVMFLAALWAALRLEHACRVPKGPTRDLR